MPMPIPSVDVAMEHQEQDQDAKKETGQAPFQIGQRVMMTSSSNKDKPTQLGTVKYVGSVQGHQGMWIGVDWDCADDGRHDGSLGGIRYFQAQRPTSASFIRPHLLSAGHILLHAMISRYKGDSQLLEDGRGRERYDDNTGVVRVLLTCYASGRNWIIGSVTEDMFVLSVRQKHVTVELVGKEDIKKKQQHFEELSSASLVYKGVAAAGEFENVLPNLKELDLTGNLLPDWQAVNHICAQLPALRVLDLSKNRLCLSSSSLPALARLQTLVLNFCQLSWAQVNVLKLSLPMLEELHLCGNEINMLELENGCEYVEGFRNLRLLNLENNDIELWDEILKLSRLESLEQLQLSHNKIKQIFYPKDDECADKPFMPLRCILLAANHIEEWSSVDALNHFPNLKEVRLSDNPLTDLSTGGAPRYILVARLAQISVLNGSEIRQRERNDSEIRYVHYVMSTMPINNDEERTRAHPRYLELKKLYDLDEEQLQTRKAAGSEKMADSLRAITIVCVALSVGEKAPSIKKLPLSTTIGKLKLVCESLFKVKASKQRLYLREQDVPVPVPLDEDRETLRDVGVGFETTILVDEVGM